LRNGNRAKFHHGSHAGTTARFASSKSVTLNPQTLQQMMMVAWDWAAEFLPRLAGALAILVVGLAISGWIARGTRNIVQRTPHLDPALKPIIVAVVRYSVVGFIIVITLDQIGFHTSSLLAVIGAAGLAIGLALQGTLSNIAAGIMLLWLRPFQVMDYIEVAGQGGSVEEIGLFGCKLRTFDGLFLFLPNSTIWNAPLKNHTRNHGRLISLDISLPVAADLAEVREVLVQAAAGTKEVLTRPPPKVFLENLTAAAAVVSLMLWSTPQGAGDVERQLIERIRIALEKLGDNFRAIQITRTIPADTDPSRFLEGREPIPYWKT
jgi:small conductance mechanosensitive channel